jgi:hypothetical protein
MSEMGTDSIEGMRTSDAKRLLGDVMRFEVDVQPSISQAERERLHQLDLHNVDLTIEQALANLAQMELAQKQEKDSAGLIDLYSERIRKTQTVGETDAEGFQNLDLYAQKQKLRKRANGSL